MTLHHSCSTLNVYYLIFIISRIKVINYPESSLCKDYVWKTILCSEIETTILLLSWSPLYIVFLKFGKFLIKFPYFNSVILHVWDQSILEILGGPWKKQRHCFFLGAPCTKHSECTKCPDSCLFILFWHCFPQIHMKIHFFLEIVGAPRKKQ